MARVVRNKKKRDKGGRKKGETASVYAQQELKKHPEWRVAKPLSTEAKKAILDACKRRPLTDEEIGKIEQAIFDRKHRGNKPDLETIQQVWNKAIAETNKVKYVNILDNEGKVVGKEPIIDYRRKELNHILKIIKITPPILSDRVSIIDTIQQYLAICLEDGFAFTINGLALALGTTRDTLKKWVNGEARVENKDIIEQAYQMISLQTEMDIREGKGNPVGQIFLGKNDAGYVEETKHIIKNDKLDEITDEDIKNKYAGVIDLPDD